MAVAMRCVRVSGLRARRGQNVRIVEAIASCDLSARGTTDALSVPQQCSAGKAVSPSMSSSTRVCRLTISLQIGSAAGVEQAGIPPTEEGNMTAQELNTLQAVGPQRGVSHGAELQHHIQRGADLPTLLMTTAHTTGDLSVLRNGWRPVDVLGVA